MTVQGLVIHERSQIKNMTTFWWNFFWNAGPKSVDIWPRALHAEYRTLGCCVNNTLSQFSMQTNGLVLQIHVT